MEKSLKCLVGFNNTKTENQKKKNNNPKSQFERVLYYTSLYKDSLADCKSNFRMIFFYVNCNPSLYVTDDGDHLGDWWCDLFRIVAYWSLAEDDKAHELYSTIGNVPDHLLEDPLCKSLLAAFSAKCEIK